MAAKTILIMDDEEGIRSLVQWYLKKKGYNILTAASGEEGLMLMNQKTPDLIILDIEMPGMDGFEVCREIRKNRTLPIIFLSVRDDVMDKLKCFELGGDDYVIKPFDYAELEARIRANLRRYDQAEKQKGSNMEILSYNGLTIYMKEFKCYLHGQLIPLSAKEIKLLILLARHPRQMWSAEQIYDHIWGYESFGDLQTVKVHISHLRRKLETDPANPKFIHTVKGLGYVFEYEGDR